MADKQTLTAEESIPFYPDQVRRELWVAGGLLVGLFIIGALAMISPLGLGEPADPLNTPAHVKPEWYFLALYQLLKFIPKTTGAVLPVIAVLVLLFWPFIDRRPDTSRQIYWVRLVVVLVALVLGIALTIWGEVS